MILKIGGSVLTEKDDEEVLAENFEDILKVVAYSAPDDLVLVHGAGSFGHPHAVRHGIGEDTPSREGGYETHAAVARLNRRVVETLDRHGTDALPVHPSSCAWRDGGTCIAPEAVERLRTAGFLPVAHGDVIADSRGGVSVLSGDELAVELAAEDERVGMCTSAGGVLDEAGDRMERVSSVEELTELSGDTDDVTRGIRGKVERLLSLPSGGRVFGPDEIGAYLDGEEVGTLVRR
ncbi:MAG: isopentenyl phosphate kinase [Halobacteria archaeon]